MGYSPLSEILLLLNRDGNRAGAECARSHANVVNASHWHLDGVVCRGESLRGRDSPGMTVPAQRHRGRACPLNDLEQRPGALATIVRVAAQFKFLAPLVLSRDGLSNDHLCLLTAERGKTPKNEALSAVFLRSGKFLDV